MRPSWRSFGEKVCRAFRVYTFIRAHRTVHTKLPASVAKELTMFVGILPLLYHDMRAEWCDEIYMCDASTAGQGVVSWHAPSWLLLQGGTMNGGAGRRVASLGRYDSVGMRIRTGSSRLVSR
eukprot:12150762-Heterocapsa_arctica.AAC.1